MELLIININTLPFFITNNKLFFLINIYYEYFLFSKREKKNSSLFLQHRVFDTRSQAVT